MQPAMTMAFWMAKVSCIRQGASTLPILSTWEYTCYTVRIPLWRKGGRLLPTVLFRGRTVRCARAVHALREKFAVLHHREFGKFRRLEGCH